MSCRTYTKSQLRTHRAHSVLEALASVDAVIDLTWVVVADC